MTDKNSWRFERRITEDMIRMTVGVDDILDWLVGDAPHRFSKRTALAHAAAGIDDRNSIAANDKTDIGDGPLVLRVHQFIDPEVNVNAWRHLADRKWIEAFQGTCGSSERRNAKGYADPYYRIEAAQKKHRDTVVMCRSPLTAENGASQSNCFGGELRGCDWSAINGMVRCSIAAALRPQRCATGICSAVASGKKPLIPLSTS